MRGYHWYLAQRTGFYVRVPSCPPGETTEKLVKVKRSVLVMCAVFAALPMAVPAGAGTVADVLIYQDYVVGTSAIPGALALWGGCVICTTTTDSTVFNN